MLKKIKLFFILTKEAGKEFARHQPLLMGASISFYVLLALGPILSIILITVGAVLGETAVQGKLVSEIESAVGSQPAEQINEFIETAYKFPSKTMAILSSIPLLFFGCTMIFYQIRTSLNIVWEVKEESGGGIMKRIKGYSLSFLILLIVGFLIFLLVLKSSLLGMFESQVEIPFIVYRLLDFIISFALLTVLFSMVYKILPKVKLSWREVLVGGGITAFFFVIVQILVAVNFSNSGIESALGALGSITILFLWIFYSSLIFLFGANYAKVYSNTLRRGRKEGK
jgi:membrane protein